MGDIFLLNEMNDLLTERLFQSSAAGIIFVKAKRKALGPVTREAASLFLYIVSSLMYGLKNYYLSLIHSIAHKYGEVCRNRQRKKKTAHISAQFREYCYFLFSFSCWIISSTI